MKHKTFSKENEKKLKLIIKAQKDEIRRLEIEIRDLKKEIEIAGKPRKPKPPKEKKPTLEVKPPTKQVDPKIKSKAAVIMSAEDRKAFCDDFAKRFKKSRGDDGTSDSAD